MKGRSLALVLALLLLLCACTEQPPALTTGEPQTLAPLGEGILLQPLSPEAMPAATSAEVREWMEECDTRRQVTDAVLYCISDGVCSLLLYSTDLKQSYALSAVLEGDALLLSALSKTEDAARSLYVLSFPTDRETLRISLRLDGASHGLLTRRVTDPAILSGLLET